MEEAASNLAGGCGCRLWPNLVLEMLALTQGQPNRLQQVSLRSQAEGPPPPPSQLLSLAVDVGDPIQQGQSLATLDSSLLQTDLR